MFVNFLHIKIPPIIYMDNIFPKCHVVFQVTYGIFFHTESFQFLPSPQLSFYLNFTSSLKSLPLLLNILKSQIHWDLFWV